MHINRRASVKVVFVLFCLGAPGIISISDNILEMIFASLGLLFIVWLGLVCSRNTQLGVPVISASVKSGNSNERFKPKIIPALFAAFLGAVFVILVRLFFSFNLPNEYQLVHEVIELSWHAGLFFEGLTTEIVVHWGIMSFIIWRTTRATMYRDANEVSSRFYFSVILLCSVILGAAYCLPLSRLDIEVTYQLLFCVGLEGAGFSLISGYLFWKYGLECALASSFMFQFIIMCAT